MATRRKSFKEKEVPLKEKYFALNGKFFSFKAL
jgi:hypothetical protein